MALNLEIITPDGVAFKQSVSAVTIPAVEGEMQILPMHIPLLTFIKPGEIIAKDAQETHELAVDKGYVRVQGDTVSVLTEAAIEIEHIDLESVAEAEARAQEALAEAKSEKHLDPAEIERLESVARFALVQRLSRQKRV